MKIFLLKLLFLSALLILQCSFLNVLFPFAGAPLVIISAVVAWVLVLGFQRALFMTLPLTILYDLFLSGEIRPFSLWMIAVAYGTSFASRRLLVDHRGFALFLYGAFTVFGAFGTIILENLVAGRTGFAIFHMTKSAWALPVIGMIVFFAVYYGVRRSEAYLDRLRQEQNFKLR
ncbi:MAG: hypothetical protein A2808_03350 [Candidatus Moranbacteria bacterium RIFCSPHIGHO2_01_FULL_55_24]|nr:MAG: hypothetical protein A2808_03350 [Candidatus Moranbacteria bacterium RIFCSPHIGHO2_01_FULL_55_24]